MAVVAADVTGMFPEFTPVNSAEMAAVISMASGRIDQSSGSLWSAGGSTWTNTQGTHTLAELAVVFLVAHCLSVTHPALTESGPVTAESIKGAPGLAYMVPRMEAAEDLDLTPYGRQLKALRQETIPSVLVL